MIKYIKKIVAVVLLIALFIWFIVSGVREWGFIVFFLSLITALIIFGVLYLSLKWLLDD